MPTRITTHPLSTADLGVTNAPVDLALARRLRRSFDVLSPMADEVAVRFYASLFAAHPPIRAMFPTDMTRQRQLLMQTLTWIITHLGDHKTLDESITALGQRHTGYGAKPQHYAVVIQHLVQAMTEVADDRWTSDDRADWKAALSLIAERMIAAGDTRAGGARAGR